MPSVTHPNVGFLLRSSTVRVEPPRGLLGLRFGEVWPAASVFIFSSGATSRSTTNKLPWRPWVALQPVLTIPLVIQFWMLPLLSTILLRSFPRTFAGFVD
jgi:hypothetical protein